MYFSFFAQSFVFPLVCFIISACVSELILWLVFKIAQDNKLTQNFLLSSFCPIKSCLLFIVIMHTIRTVQIAHLTLKKNLLCPWYCGNQSFPPSHLFPIGVNNLILLLQDLVIEVQRTLCSTAMEFTGNLDEDNELESLIDSQLVALRKVFRIPHKPLDESHGPASKKLLTLFRSGKLGPFILDDLPDQQWRGRFTCLWMPGDCNLPGLVLLWSNAICHNVQHHS